MRKILTGLFASMVMAATVTAFYAIGAEQAVTETESEQRSNGAEEIAITDSGLEDGVYSFEGELKGGSGKAFFDGPLYLYVSSDESKLRFTMSSSYYDYVYVDGEKYEPVNEEGNSEFIVPIEYVNCAFEFLGDTTKMSEPHEIEYSVDIYEDDLVDVSSDFETESETETGSNTAITE